MKWTLLSAVALASATLWAACTPASAPPPPPAPTAAPTVVPTSNLSPPTSPDPWTKVVEAAHKEGQVNLYAFSFTGDIAAELSRAFKEKYGIKVDIITGRGAELIERLKTEQRMGRVVGDVMESSLLNVVSAKEAGAGMAPGDLPSLREKGVWLMPPALDTEGIALAYIATPISVWPNTKLVKPEDEPRSWKELLSPKWKGKMIMLDPALSSGSYLAFVPLLNNKVIDEDYLRSLGMQDMALELGSSRDTFKKVGAGQYLLAVGLSGSTAGPLVNEGLPIKAVDMAEGVTVSGLGMAMVRNGPHPNAARLFLNWSLSAEGQAKLSQQLSAPGVRSDIPDFSPVGVRIKPKKLVPLTVKDLADEARLFQEKYLVQFFRKR